MDTPVAVPVPRLDPRKFRDPDVTAKGEARASVEFRGFGTLWFNTGTLCNLACVTCYIESSPRNDSLVYLTHAEVLGYLDEMERTRERADEIGFTGGEPFMNPDFVPMLESCLSRGYRVLVLTNAMRPMMKQAEPLLDLRRRWGERLVMRVSLDHYGRDLHEIERGPRSWEPTMKGLRWLAEHGFAVHVAGRLKWGEREESMRAGYARLFAELGLATDAADPAELMLFPEMDAQVDVPEITTACWGILGKSPDDMMCATSRMVVKHRGADRPTVVACTLLPYDPQFDMGGTLAEASRAVKLNHPHCAKFCVLGGASCSKTG
ncbi:MAG: radical SAM protein [Acetobacterales bacterium]